MSSWINFPQKYKFTGLEILVDYDRTYESRRTYGILKYLGDLGGFQQATSVLSIILLSIHNKFKYQDRLMQMLFWTRNRSCDTITKDFESRAPYKSKGIWSNLLQLIKEK
jgi:hypothetical protein